MSLPRESLSRRRFLRRRLFFCNPLLTVAVVAGAGYAGPQVETPSSTRIVSRQIRVTREVSGQFRVLESFRLAVVHSAGDTAASDAQLPIIVLQDGARGVQTISREIPPEQIIFDPPRLILRGSAPGSAQLVISYNLPADWPEIEFRAELWTEEFILDIDRGSIEARPDRALSAAGPAGSTIRPRRRYRADNVAADSVLSLDLVSKRTDWRERLAVLLATALAASLALVWVWRGVGAAVRR